MKAVEINEYGSADILKIVDVEIPVPNTGEVLVKIHSASVNPVDWKIRNGSLKLLSGSRFPKRLGSDFSGTIEALGPQVKNFQLGDEVFGFVNPLKGGAYAEYISVNINQLALKPSQVSFQEAAAIPLAGSTALQSLCDLASIKPGMKVLINGASGGVGLFALQIAVALYTEVTGVCGSKNSTLIKHLGANHVINYENQDFKSENIRYDVIFDVVGNQQFQDCADSLTKTGSYITTIPSLKNVVAQVITPLLSKQRAKIISVKNNTKDLRGLNNLIEAKKLQVVIDQELGLSEIIQAHQYSETQRAVGKIILTM